MIFGTLAWTIELYMTKYIIGEIFSSGGVTLYKNPSDKTVNYLFLTKFIKFYIHENCIYSEALEDIPEVQVINDYCNKLDFPMLEEVNECFSR